jgi:hypothetical protein
MSLALARIGGLFLATNRYPSRVEFEYQLTQARTRLVIGDGGVSFNEVPAAADAGPIAPFADEWAPKDARPSGHGHF